MTVNPHVEEEFCPSCGDWFDTTQMNEGTGFCLECSPSLQSFIVVSRIERWLAKYADTIESEMIDRNVTARVAINIVLENHRATCIICKNPIKHGTYGRHFICSTTSKCKQARRRYKYLVYDKGYSKEDAIKRVTGE